MHTLYFIMFPMPHAYFILHTLTLIMFPMPHAYFILHTLTLIRKNIHFIPITQTI